MMDYGTSGGWRRKRGPGTGTICGVLIVVILAIVFGILAYNISNKNLAGSPTVPTVPPTPEIPTMTPSPTPTPTKPPTPVPTSPETGLPCTPTPSPSPTLTPTPTPSPTPAWDEGYLVGWKDTREPVNVIGAYAGLNLTGANVERWLEFADTTELNAVVIDVKADTGKVTYHMDVDWMKETDICVNTYSDMKGLLRKLKEHGIYTIARIVCFRDNYADEIHPEYMIHLKDGTIYTDNKGDTWMNPYVEDTWEYIVDIAEQAALDGFDEICFDYIRFATNGLKEADYGPLAEELSKEQIITAFTKYACNRLKPTGAFVSASVYGAVIRSSVDAEIVGQNYVEMSRYLDYICPMVYPSHYAKTYAGIAVPDAAPYELMSGELKESVKKLDALALQQDTYAECRPWLQAFTASWVKGHISYTGPVVRKQIKAVYDTGHTSWMLWNSTGKYPEGSFLQE